MNKSVLDLSEKEVQCLIADYPWLLNLDYEIIPQLKNKGMEYQLTENKRADLILKDKKSGRPVIVEFKAVPFYRENIGQILEYKARIINEYSSENSILKEIFGEKMFTPILILVVPECTAEARLACNLSSIDIYEYSANVPEIIMPEKREMLDDFISNYSKDDIPFSEERDEFVNGIYNRIYELLCEEDLTNGWKNYKDPAGEYFVVMNHLFINKCIFSNYDVSIGIYENIFSDSSEIIIEYYSANSKILNEFSEKYMELDLKPSNDSKFDSETYNGAYWSFKTNKKDFLENTKQVLKPYISNYIKVMKELDLY
ncbi:PDDEXK family nuclease [Clostridium sp. DL1XJH146]